MADKNSLNVSPDSEADTHYKQNTGVKNNEQVVTIESDVTTIKEKIDPPPVTFTAIDGLDTIIFNHKERIVIVMMVMCIFMVSSFPINIFAPSLVEIMKEFGTVSSIVNISVSGYRAFDAFFPTLWGPISDQIGRRPVYMAGFLVAALSNVGVALSPNVYVLITVRMVQAIGCSALRVNSAGVINDISTPATRAGYAMYNIIGTRICAIIGPVLGGIIAQHLSWRWIFWIMLCFTVCVFVVIVLCLPETMRLLAGGKCKPTPFKWWGQGKQNGLLNGSAAVDDIAEASYLREKAQEDAVKSRFKKIPDFRAPYRFLLIPDVVVVMLMSGIYSGVVGCYTINIPYLYQQYYNLNAEQIGLCFLARSIGSIIGAIFGGRYQNYKFRKTISVFNENNKDKTVEKKKRPIIPLNFPIYKTRLLYIWSSAIIIQLLTILHGWVFVLNVHIAVPLTIHFCVAFNMALVLGATTCLVYDLLPGKGASISASINLVANALGALGTGLMGPALDALGPGWTYTLLGGILMITNVMLLVLLKYGIRWRTRRVQKRNQASTG